MKIYDILVSGLNRPEKKPLETAAYRPLIQKKAVEITEREVIGLSTQGKKGANLRSGPGASYAVPRELKGNVPEGRMVSCEGEWKKAGFRMDSPIHD